MNVKIPSDITYSVWRSALIASMRPLVVKLLFRLKHPLLLQLSIELVASLNVRPLFASNELLSVLASFARHPMLYSP